MSITLKEKEKIMKSLHDKIDRKIMALTQLDPTYEHKVFQEARKRSHSHHGIEQKKMKFEKVLEKLWKTKDEAEALYCEMIAQVTGKSVQDIRTESVGYSSEKYITLSRLRDFSRTLERCAESKLQFYADQVLSESDVGREIKVLRDQKKFVDDAVMLATTSAKLYPIYERVLQAIGETATPMLAAGMAVNGQREQLPAPKN